MVSFNQIPSNLRTPGVFVEFDPSRAQQGTALKAYRALVVGQKRSTGTQPDLTPVRVTSQKSAETLFGVGSQLATMAASWFAANRFTEVWFCALEDPGSGTAATGSLTLTVSGPQAGTLVVYVGGRRYAVTVTTSTTQNGLASAVATAVNADSLSLVSAAAVANVVTFTSRQVGTLGNLIDIRVNYQDGESTPQGVTASVSNMTAGTGDVDLSTLWPVVGDEQYDVLVVPVTDATNLSSLEVELAARWGPERMIEGVAFTATNASHGNAAALGNARNSPHVSIASTFGSPQPAYQIAASIAATAAFYAAQDPARPFQTLELPGIMPPSVSSRFTQEERNALLFDGVSTLKVGPGGTVQIERLISTYQLNVAGADDTAYLDLTTVFTLGFLRYSLRTRLRNKFPRHKVADDDTRFDEGQAIVTPSSMRAEVVALYGEWMALGLVEAPTDFAQNLIVARSTTDPTRLEVLIPPDLVNPLIVIAGQIQFRL